MSRRTGHDDVSRTLMVTLAFKILSYLPSGIFTDSYPLCNLRHFMILLKYVEQFMTMFRVQEWQLVCIIFKLFPLDGFMLCFMSALWYFMFLHTFYALLNISVIHHSHVVLLLYVFALFCCCFTSTVNI